jgi:hypothetical protein
MGTHWVMELKDVFERLDRIILLLEKQHTRRYKIVTTPVTQPMGVPSDCNEIIFVNNGQTNAVVNGIKLVPGASWGDSGYHNGMDTTIYEVKFPLPLTGTSSIVAYRKFFID